MTTFLIILAVIIVVAGFAGTVWFMSWAEKDTPYHRNTQHNASGHHHDTSTDDSFRMQNDWADDDWRDISSDKRHRSKGSGNWTDRSDWDCGSPSSDGMSGWDSYEDNDF